MKFLKDLLLVVFTILFLLGVLAWLFFPRVMM